MTKHTQTIRRQKATNYLSVFDHFVRLALKGIKGMREGGESKISLCYPSGLGASPVFSLAQFQRSEMSPGLFQDFMDGYIKF